MARTGEFRCKDSPYDPNCHKLLFKMDHLDIRAGSLEVKCRCGHINILESCALIGSRIES